jgi:hypothetical protein
MRRADIHAVGIVQWEPDGTIVAVQGWHMEGGDAPGISYDRQGRPRWIGGWTPDELRVICMLWIVHRFPPPIPGDQFGPVPEPPQATALI